uniref:Uncharacterized protein n=1 Tax=Lactuca sativa TaxID=4236 RepID=A0A9R1UJF4_LACSA|nr:hypothetical protein LSAT_V11C900467110 [Lactuca sativa]
MGARVSLYSSLEVLGTKEAKLERLNRVQTSGLGFLPKQGLLVGSGDRLAESKAWTPRRKCKKKKKASKEDCLTSGENKSTRRNATFGINALSIGGYTPSQTV